MSEVYFETGETVICTGPRGVPLTMGKEHEVLDFSPEYMEPDNPACYTWPAYVTVIGDDGKKHTVHADRFKKAEK